jgi:nucleoside-diphosphate-sugar epimerase
MKILVTGASGLIGAELVPALEHKYASENVIVSDIRPTSKPNGLVLDITNIEALESAIISRKIDTLYHLAGLLSAGSEKNPELAWRINLGGLKNVLDVGIRHKLKIFWPSSIAVFGPTTPKTNTPQHTILEPTTIYGVTKYAGELLCQYYHRTYGLDVRSLRYPGVNSPKGTPGDGTTEYAIWIFHKAIQDGRYECFLSKDTRLPMMYIDDAVGATLKLMEASRDKLKVDLAYNLTAVSFTPAQLASELKKLVDFEITYQPDIRQKTADTWPETIDDSCARKDWGWQPKYDLPKMTQVMFDYINTHSKEKSRSAS